jgi:hypothetical protein
MLIECLFLSFDSSKGKAIVITEGKRKSLSAVSHEINWYGLSVVGDGANPTIQYLSGYRTHTRRDTLRSVSRDTYNIEVTNRMAIEYWLDMRVHGAPCPHPRYELAATIDLAAAMCRMEDCVAVPVDYAHGNAASSGFVRCHDDQVSPWSFS